MRLYIEARTLADQRWFPIFDVLLLHIEEGRHSFSLDGLQALLACEWFRPKAINERDLIKKSATVRSQIRLADRSLVVIDSRTPRGGRIDDDYTTSLHPLDCITFLSQPFSVIVENEWFDGAYLLWMAKVVDREKFISSYRANHFVFRHAGGKGSLARSAVVLSKGVWPTPNDRSVRAMKLWACVVLDNDAKFPRHNPNAIIKEELTPLVSFIHELARRSIESYLPYTALTRYDNTSGFKEKIDALSRLTKDQRKHYHMKNGFRYDRQQSPSKVDYAAAAEVHANEKNLFCSVPDSDWPRLASGFGKKLSSIFVENHFRPDSNDKTAIDNDDILELRILIDAIYERI